MSGTRDDLKVAAVDLAKGIFASNVYDVTLWKVRGSRVTAQSDLGAVINDIIADVKRKQPDPADKPGAVVYIPPGSYSLKTRVVVDVSYLTIRGSGHGFTSLSIRYNSDTAAWQELNPGGSHVKVENTDGHSEAFLVSRTGDPRLSSVTFENFCLDGVSFGADQNSYRNGKVGIRFATATDATRVRGMGMVYLERGLIVQDADALDVSGNFLAECGSCIELVGSGQASKVADNHLGAGPIGFSLFAESHNGLLITGNNVFPRGIDSVHLKNCYRSAITSNRLHSFYPGMITLEGNCKENLIGSNVLERQVETYGPFLGVGNGRDDLFGVVQINGDGNTVTGNHVSLIVPPEQVAPAGATAAVFRVQSGDQNQIGVNHVITNLAVHTVVLDAGTTNSHVFDSGTEAQFSTASTSYGFRPTP
ncbi:inulin fructotransferase (DFA-I-forming) [Rathayibacter sp. PhB152]|uniref:NosD domain-containing protein n=1 Tax=Rathayibacter sp. PhB152 TaxID=2485190 RepID=UPI000F969AF8|nr:NosD domain-containing protein [Rathayibacter sp. PhB152]ROQ64722.1 inulin fructotransferase (DFA-I-forming) [Rathayibacter sp. PhB152]